MLNHCCVESNSIKVDHGTAKLKLIYTSDLIKHSVPNLIF